MKSETLLSLLKVKKVYGEFPETVNHITQDSREANEDSVFVAGIGLRTDRHQFIPQVIEKGCRFIVASREVDVPENVGVVVVKNTDKVAALFSEYIYEFPHSEQTMIGVTGTNGKTTVATMIHHLSRALGKKSAYLGTNGFMINDEHTESANTTPETTRLHQRLKEANDRGTEVFTMEVSSHGLQLGRTFGIDFDITVYTNLTQDHLDFHKSMDAYGFSKGLLFSQMGQDIKRKKYAVMNFDDAWTHMYENMTPFEVITYGSDNGADFYPTNIQGSLDGFQFTLNTPEGTFEVDSPYIGEFNIHNLMCAIISLWLQGHKLSEIIEDIPNMAPVAGRLEVLDKDLPIDVLIDYAHTPDALIKIMETVKPFVKGKFIFLIGMTGERDYSKAKEMGRIATKADFAIFTPDNPANDDPKMLVELLSEGASGDHYKNFVDREEGIKFAIDMAEPGDTIVIACKGREPYQIGKDYVKIPHRDDLIALDAAYKKFYGEDYDRS